MACCLLSRPQVAALGEPLLLLWFSLFKLSGIAGWRRELMRLLLSREEFNPSYLDPSKVGVVASVVFTGIGAPANQWLPCIH